MVPICLHSRNPRCSYRVRKLPFPICPFFHFSFFSLFIFSLFIFFTFHFFIFYYHRSSVSQTMPATGVHSRPELSQTNNAYKAMKRYSSTGNATMNLPLPDYGANSSTESSTKKQGTSHLIQHQFLSYFSKSCPQSPLLSWSAPRNESLRMRNSKSRNCLKRKRYR